MTRIAKAALPLLCASIAVAAHAQDGAPPTPPTPSPAPPAAQAPTLRTAPRPKLGPFAAGPTSTSAASDGDGAGSAQHALSAARVARERAACLERHAKRTEISARRLKTAATDRQLERAYDDMANGLYEMEQCTWLPTKGVVDVTQVSAKTKAKVPSKPPCRAGDPLCSDIGDGGAKNAERWSMILDGMLQAREKPFRACFLKGLLRNPDLSGSLDYRAKLNEAGAVKISSLDVTRDTLGSEPVRKCVDRELRAMTFGRAHAGSTAAFRLSFDP